MVGRRGRCLLAVSGVVALAGCGEPPNEHVGRTLQPIAEAGPWHIPADVLAVGDEQYVDYTGAGPWLGESGCYGGISPATDLLRDYIYAHFPQTYHIGGYACRPIVGNESKMSVHATGRALDIMLHTVDGEADNTIGDPVGNWLIENAEAIGIQFIIWDLYTWMASRDPGTKGKDYGGSHPHHDHLHIELAEEYADLTENWFEDLVEPPMIDGCPFVPPDGGIVEETSPCFGAFGPNEYWRLVEGVGSDGSLLWTNAFENDEPSNWARWNLYVEEAGLYRVEVFVDPEYGVNPQTRYALRHEDADGPVTELFSVDQGVEQQWVDLGQWDFAAGVGQYLSVYDNVEAPVGDDQRIAVDAVRLTRLDGGGSFDPSGPGLGDDPSEPGGSASKRSADEGGCRVSAPGVGPRGSTSWLALLGLGLFASRRRRP